MHSNTVRVSAENIPGEKNITSSRISRSPARSDHVRDVGRFPADLSNLSTTTPRGAFK